MSCLVCVRHTGVPADQYVPCDFEEWLGMEQGVEDYGSDVRTIFVGAVNCLGCANKPFWVGPAFDADNRDVARIGESYFLVYPCTLVGFRGNECDDVICCA